MPADLARRFKEPEHDLEAWMKARAADIAVRFSGPEGQRALVDLLSRQSLFEGNHNVARAIAAAVVVV